MASSGHFDPSQTYDGYRAVAILDTAGTECLAKGKDCFQHYNPQSSKCHYCFIGKKPFRRTGVSSSNIRRQRDVARWTSVGGPISVGGRPIYSSSEVPISRINTERVVKRIRGIADSTTYPDAEGSDELDGEEAVVVPHSVGHSSRNSSVQPLSNIFQSQVIPSTPRTFHSYYHSTLFTKYFSFQASLESSSKTITNPATQELTHNHLSTTPTCGQFQ
ncbi:hypothetical protein O181_097519 [Austropuccinia psidii MF-1]|uniref:Uncharacterized protein n=1 Tax=Austropuccinia psidii MF-1 TaxID=1389203 RepID=A0A9Q3J925_9BASI|nr:hypothetical protein [Austropuccinia psidii MF-1]